MVERICSNCKGSNLRRSSRQGFLETFVYSLAGRFPWRCRNCGTRTMLRDRGDSRNHTGTAHVNGRA